MLTELVFGCPNAEEQAYLLVHLGADGVEIRSPQQLCCYCPAPKAGEFVEKVCAAGFSLVSRREIPDKNWVAECQELWAPLQIDDLEIVPCLDLANLPTTHAHQILIHPSTGFGTGHHATTRMMVSLIQKIIPSQAPKRILDLGTGSGILAMACAKVYSAEIVAYDLDPLALENAKLNFELNGLSKRITLQEGSLSDVGGSFDLIVANIYAEVLKDLEPLFRARINLGGRAILSGILDTARTLIDLSYGPGHWRRLTERTEGAWHAVALELES